MDIYNMMWFGTIVPSSGNQAQWWCSNGAGIPYDILVISKSIAWCMYLLIDGVAKWLNVYWKLNYH